MKKLYCLNRRDVKRIKDIFDTEPIIEISLEVKFISIDDTQYEAHEVVINGERTYFSKKLFEKAFSNLLST